MKQPIKLVRCPDCGYVINANGRHVYCPTEEGKAHAREMLAAKTSRETED